VLYVGYNNLGKVLRVRRRRFEALAVKMKQEEWDIMVEIYKAGVNRFIWTPKQQKMLPWIRMKLKQLKPNGSK